MNYNVENPVEIIDLSTMRIKGGYNRIAANKIRITSSSETEANLSFSRELTNEVISRGLTYLNFAVNNITGEVFFVFSKRGYSLKLYKGATSFRIGNISLIKKLIEIMVMNAIPKNMSLTISDDMSRTDTSMTFKIIDIEL